MKLYMKGTIIILAIAVTTVIAARVGLMTLGLGWRRHPPLREQIEDGKAIVLKLEEFKAKHGRYPSEAEAAEVLPGKFRTYDGQKFDAWKWYYFPFEPNFTLYRFTGHLGERLTYSDVPFDDRIPRWYLRDEGGPVHLLPADH